MCMKKVIVLYFVFWLVNICVDVTSFFDFQLPCCVPLIQHDIMERAKLNMSGDVFQTSGSARSYESLSFSEGGPCVKLSDSVCRMMIHFRQEAV